MNAVERCAVRMRGAYRHTEIDVRYRVSDDRDPLPICSRCWKRIGNLLAHEIRAALGVKKETSDA